MSYHKTRTGNRKLRHAFRWNSVEKADAHIARTGRHRLGRGGVIGLHNKIERDKSRAEMKRLRVRA